MGEVLRVFEYRTRDVDRRVDWTISGATESNGAYYPNSTACQGSSSFGSIPYSAPFETFGVPIIPCGSVALHEQQVMLGTDLFQSAGTKMKGGQLTILGNGPNSSVSCSVHVSKQHVHMRIFHKKVLQMVLWMLSIIVFHCCEI